MPKRRRPPKKEKPIPPEIQAINLRIQEAQNVVDALEEEKDALILSIVNANPPTDPEYLEYYRELGITFPLKAGALEVGGWECEKSPVAWCVYLTNYSGEEHCCYCGEPSERS